MTNRLKILLPILAILLTAQLCYSYLEREAYNSYIKSEHCRMLPSLVMELGIENAVLVEALRQENQDDLFFVKMADWFGTESAARDCVDIEN
jgi:hypothetical protein